ncbi:MAG: 5-carboxymethyl-2-hydroxymuconate Delta-isomerase [Proteobacteria bacterium]|nr:5-carboxymethyl-2-hydroxymuconate Delta-isomerase [Pseudomonadota bacterium]
MPHLILEYSSNIIEKDDFNAFFKEAHEILVEKISANIDACKSRAIKHEHYYLGDGNVNNAFIHLSLKIMSGRSQSALDAVSAALIALTQKHFSNSAKSLNLKISLEVSDLAHYTKI